MSLTKEQIDEIVDNAPYTHDVWTRQQSNEIRRQLYRGAGLTAEGARKPERVRLWRGKSSWTGRYVWFEREPKPDEFLLTELTPGWFVPSEEGET